MESSELVRVLFVMSIDPSIQSIPFANVRDVSYDEKKEDGNNRLWQVDLTLTSDNDLQLQSLTEHIREETFSYEEGWYRLSNLLIKLDQFDEAQQICETMLEQKPP